MFCDYCECLDCQIGTKYLSHAWTEAGRNICDVCYTYHACLDAGAKDPCEAGKLCSHRPKIIGKWRKFKIYNPKPHPDKSAILLFSTKNQSFYLMLVNKVSMIYAIDAIDANNKLERMFFRNIIKSNKFFQMAFSAAQRYIAIK